MGEGDSTKEGKLGEEEEESLDYESIAGNLELQTSKGSNILLHHERLICKVPPLLRKGNKGAFDPMVVSIGPYHREKHCVQAMKDHKKRYLGHLLRRRHPVEADYVDLLRKLADLEPKTRRCYSEKITMKKAKFVEMMCLDGCFLVELFLKIVEGPNDDELLTGPIWRLNNILRDILLLENQLPFFVLEEIFFYIKPSESNRRKLVEHSLVIFEEYKKWRNEKIPSTEPKDPYHLLHLFHTHILPMKKTKKSDPPQTALKCSCLPILTKCKCLPLSIRKPNQDLQANSMPCATTLEEKRVIFKRQRESDSFLEITYKHRTLEIPYLWVDEHTESLFRNFIALEQCCLNSKTHLHHFGAYVTVMDSVVNTQKDVEVLRRAGILEHGLGSDNEVALLFNKLNKGVIVNLRDSHLSEVYDGVQLHCKRIWNEWIADFHHRYFKSPWACLALFAAFLGLFLTTLNACLNLSNYMRLKKHQ